MTYADAFLEWLGQHGEGTSGMLASNIFKAGWDARERENRDLRDAIRLIIGRHANRPWHDVAEREVDAFLNEIRRYKEVQRARQKP